MALLGHSGSGKTTVAEALAYVTGASKRQGRVEDGNTISDYTEEEKRRGISITSSLVPVEWDGGKLNLIDAPGYFDFSGEVRAALRATEAAMLVVDASAGIEVGTEKDWNYMEKIGFPRIIFLNKMDKENVSFDKVVEDLRARFGKKVIPFSLPIGEGPDFKGVVDVIFQHAFTYEKGKSTEIELDPALKKRTQELYEMIAEVVAETDDVLIEKYFAGEPFTRDELLHGVTTALLEGHLVPLMCGSASELIGLDMLLDLIMHYMPSPDDERANLGFRYESGEERTVSSDEPFAGVVFKTVIDPFVGKLSFFKVTAGKLTKGEIYNVTREASEKVGSLFTLRGKEQLEISEAHAGDIAVVAKLSVTETGDTLCDKAHPIQYKAVKFQEPVLFFAIEPKSKGDEDKIGSALAKLTEEDPTLVMDRNQETGQLLIGGQGDTQLAVVMEKLKDLYNVEVERVPLRIAFRETIKSTASVQGRHKKQTGGAGQFGDVWIRFEPCDEDFIFDEEVFGGSVPKNFFPAVEKGLRECLPKGILAGYPVVHVKAVLYDGSYHPVDSNEQAFKTAAGIAFREGMKQAKPILLEPIYRVEVRVPEDYLGDIMGDMNKRRGRILGIEPQEDGTQLLIAEAPHIELFEYAIDLKSMTQARGTFEMSFVRYEEMPANEAQKIIDEANSEE